MKKGKLQLILILSIIFSVTSCSYDEYIETYFPDCRGYCLLVISTTTNSQAGVASPFTVSWIVENTVSDEDCHHTESNSTEMHITVQYRQNEFESWQDAQFTDSSGNTVDFISIFIPSLEPTLSFTEQRDFNFQTPGRYRFGFEIQDKGSCE